MLYILGAGDLMAGIVLALRSFKIELPQLIIVVGGLYLILKIFIFRISFPSIVDFVGGSLILFSLIIPLPKDLSIAVFLFIVFKGFSSFLPSYFY